MSATRCQHSPSFSRRHYRFIADSLALTWESYADNPEAQRAVMVAADNLGRDFSRLCYKFNWDRFIAWVKGDKS
jgi:hypothetical protein